MPIRLAQARLIRQPELPVELEHELVEIALKVRRADPVYAPDCGCRPSHQGKDAEYYNRVRG